MTRARMPIRPRPGLAALAVLVAAAGCQNGGVGTLTRWRMAHDGALAKSPTAAELGDNRGMIAQWLSPEKAPHSGSMARLPGLAGRKALSKEQAKEAQVEFDKALTLYQQGRLDEAIPALETVAKNQKDNTFGMKALYYLGEAQFQMGKYVAASDSFTKLATDYPGSEYLEKVVAREYAIALIWLAARDPKAPKEKREAWGDRFRGRIPMFDVNGHAIQALEHVAHHDVEGPLADDAILKVADYYYEKGNYEEASSYYDQIVTDYAKSPLRERAHRASIDSKIKAYLGPAYDNTGLERARELIRQHRATFPEHGPEIAQALARDLDLINDQAAETAYRDGEFYRQTGKVTAAEYCFAEVPVRWPQSPWAKKAKVQLAELAKMPRAETAPSKIMTLPGSTDPYYSGMTQGSMMSNPMGGMGMGGMGMGGAGGMPG